VGGILLKNCQGNLIARNNASVVCEGLMFLLRGDGIHLLNSDNNIVMDNTISNGFIGIYLDSSNSNRILSNQVYDNSNGIGLLGGESAIGCY
jgi:parallel beta-helix repeat protein